MIQIRWKIEKLRWISARFKRHAVDSCVRNVSAGPAVDHTTQTTNGYYMYIEASTSGLIEGSKARLISPLHQASLQKCIIFWYVCFLFLSYKRPVYHEFE